MPRKKTGRKVRTEEITYADLARILEHLVEGREQLHRDVDEMLRAVIAHREQFEEPAEEWPQLQVELEAVLELLKGGVNPPPQIAGMCLKVVPVSAGAKAGRGPSLKKRGAKKK
ncbi:MAG: hypothetical protein ACHQQS_10525 [Thermoanaerobaculales bacterium]